MRKRMMPLVLAVVSGMGQAHASDSPTRSVLDDLKAIAVAWDIGNDDWSKVCRINLKSEPAAHGLVIEKGPKCGRDFPVMDKVASWALAGKEDIELLDASGKRVLRFVLKPGDDMYSPEPQVDGINTIALVMD